jgi:polyisoprenoid-binding protein YceI
MPAWCCRHAIPELSQIASLPEAKAYFDPLPIRTIFMKIGSSTITRIGACMFLAAWSALPIRVAAQTAFQTREMDMRLAGTSNLHDWEMKAIKGTSRAVFVVNKAGKITSISSLSFSFPARNLKSDSKAMDKNTYKALNTEKNPNISFVLTSSSVKNTDGNNYQLACNGNMSIAGTTKQTTLVATGIYNATGRSFTITGVKKMKMTDYNVKPPTAVMGTIKTGNDITLSYKVKFTR